jgi:hypothetical protein
VALRTDPTTLNALLADPPALDVAIAGGSVVATGDVSALRRLLEAVASPLPGGDEPDPGRQAELVTGPGRPSR